MAFRFVNLEKRAVSSGLELVQGAKGGDETLLVEHPYLRMLRVIERIGPRNCSAISRVTGIPTETVRYRLNKHLINRDIAINPSIDYNRLDLTIAWLNLEFEDAYRTEAPELFNVLSRVGYLVYYSRTTPSGDFAAIAVPPKGRVSGYETFLKGLVDLGFLRSYRLKELAGLNYPGVWMNHYDPATGNWTIDWERLEQSEVEVPEFEGSPASQPVVDQADLFILKELQVNVTQPLVQIARKLRMDPRSLSYHYRDHILGKRLIKKHVIQWQRERPSDKDRILVLREFWQFRDLKSRELEYLRRLFNRIPFTLLEAVSADQTFYLAQTVAPLEYYITMLNYIRQHITSELISRLTSGLVDPSCAGAYSLPYEMFSKREGWMFKLERSLSIFHDIVVSVENHE